MAFRNPGSQKIKALQIPECTIRWNDPALPDGKVLFPFPKGAVVPNYYEATLFTYAGNTFDAGTLLLGIKKGGVGVLHFGDTVDELDLTTLTIPAPVFGGGSIRDGLQEWSPSLFSTGTQLKQTGNDTICVQSIGGDIISPIRGAFGDVIPPDTAGYFMLFGDHHADWKKGDQFYFLHSGVPGLDGLYTLSDDSFFEAGGDPKTLLPVTAGLVGIDETEPNGILFRRGMQATQGNGAIQTLVSQVVQIGQPVSF